MGTRTPGSIVQWTVRLPADYVEYLKQVAAQHQIPPSHLVEHWLRLGEAAEASDGA